MFHISCICASAQYYSSNNIIISISPTSQCAYGIINLYKMLPVSLHDVVFTSNVSNGPLLDIKIKHLKKLKATSEGIRKWQIL